MFSTVDTNAVLLVLRNMKVDAAIGALCGRLLLSAVLRQWNTQPIQNFMNTTIQ